jgi:hypothetical protein
MPVIPTLRRLWQEDYEFKASLGYMARPCFKKQIKRYYFLLAYVLLFSFTP